MLCGSVLFKVMCLVCMIFPWFCEFVVSTSASAVSWLEIMVSETC